MPLSVALVSEDLHEGDSRADFLAGALRRRGDVVTSFKVPYGASALSQWWSLGAALAGVAALRRRGAVDVLCVSGGSRTMSLLGTLARPAGIELVVDLALLGREGHVADVILSLAASRLVARDPRSYEALLAAGAPAYQVGIVRDPPSRASLEPRAKEPEHKHKVQLRVTALDGPALTLARDALAAAEAADKRVRAELRAPVEAEGVLPVEPGAVEGLLAANLAWVVATAPGSQAAALEAAAEAMAVGVPLLWTGRDAPAGAEAVAAADVAARVLALAKDKAARAALAERGRAWDEEHGHKTQERLWLRAIDAACADKVAELRRAKQAAIEGVKTGKRKDS